MLPKEMEPPVSLPGAGAVGGAAYLEAHPGLWKLDLVSHLRHELGN